jgi:molybdopterin molybdotransferase
MKDIAQKIFDEILNSFSPLSKEFVPTANALGRIIAEPVYARVLMPEYNVSVVDGYAINCSDIKDSGANLKILGESNSAHPYLKDLQPQTAIKIYAGGKIPVGADAVVTNAKIEQYEDYISIKSHVISGENILSAGIDFNTKEIAFKPSTIMTSRLVGLASTMKILWLPVVQKPRVGIFAVGSELAMPGEVTQKNTVTASSIYSLSANIIASGGEAIVLGVVSDDNDKIKKLIELAKNCDLLITTGATSASAGNLMKKVLSEISKDLQTLNVQLNRNDCMFFARSNNLPICSLPGNPISASIYFSLFVEPIINKLVGMQSRKKQYAVLGRNLDKHDTSVSFLHSSLSIDESGKYVVIPVSAQDGFLLSELAKSDCLTVINENKELKKGEFVEIIQLSHSLISS